MLHFCKYNSADIYYKIHLKDVYHVQIRGFLSMKIRINMYVASKCLYDLSVHHMTIASNASHPGLNEEFHIM